MVEAAAGTVGDRPAATGGAADGSETRKLVSEAYAREEIRFKDLVKSSGVGGKHTNVGHASTTLRRDPA